MLPQILKVAFAAALLYLIAVFVVTPLARQIHQALQETSPAHAQAVPEQSPALSDIGDSGILNFAPGQAVLTVNEQQKLFMLMGRLQKYPDVVLRIAGSYDPQLDKGAMLGQAFDRRYEKLEQKLGRDKAYQWMYRQRYGLRALWALSKRYKKGWGRYDYEKLNAEIKHRLVKTMSLDQEVLKGLGVARARLVYQFLAVNGFDARNMELGKPQSIQARQGYVPLDLTLAVFDKH